jgi:tight adherence protein B
MAGLIIFVLVFSGVMLLFLGLSGSGRGGGINARLERYAAGKPEMTGSATSATQASAGLANVLAQSVALARLNRVVEQRDFGASLARDIARADLKLKPGEFMAIWAGSIIGVPALFALLGLVFTALATPPALLIGAVFGFFLPRMWLGRRRASRLNAFNKQLPETITLIANALRAGSSFLQAIEMVVRESTPPVTIEFGRVVREVNLGLAFDVALENMVRRVRSDDLELMATAIGIQHQVGGNLAEILDSIAFTIRERVRIKGEINTLTAQQRLSGYVVAGMPIGVAAILMIIAPTFMNPMVQNPPGIMGLPAGVIILCFSGLFMFIGFILIRRIVAIEV